MKLINTFLQKANSSAQKVCVLFCAFIFFLAIRGYNQISPNDFVTTWKTNNTNIFGSPQNSIVIPAVGTGYNYDIDWNNDGIFDTLSVKGEITHQYTTPGTYTIRIRGSFPRICFGKDPNTDRHKIININQWGSVNWSSMEDAFNGCYNLSYTATDTPNLGLVSSLKNMFKRSSIFNGNISNWNVSNISDMSGLFFEASAFNQNIGLWNVGNVINMSSMFYSASSFNQPLNNWNVFKVTDMSDMFFFAASFNQPLHNWDVSNVTNMSSMFSNAATFNQNLGLWNVSKVTNMFRMFGNAQSFNQNIESWDVSKVTDMSYMFFNATVFNQPLNNWDVSKVTSMSCMFQNAQAFNQELSSWNVYRVQDMSYMFSNARFFNRNINSWNVANVTNMSFMFSNLWNFNQPLNSWNVSRVKNMNSMFTFCSRFNQPINNWTVDSVLDMSRMFFYAIFFNQNLGTWSLNTNVILTEMLNDAGLSVSNYDSTLIGWSLQNTLHRNLGAFRITYCNGQAARNILTTTKGWNITGDNFYCVTLPVQLQSFLVKADKENAVLTWTTSKEINNAGFDVQRSDNGLQWKTIGYLSAQDSISTNLNYRFIDTKPINGINFYRLKQIDKDGKYFLSKVVQAYFSNSLVMQLYPNPTKGTLFLQGVKEGFIEVRDITGRVLIYHTYTNGTINLNHLQKGVYSIRIVTEKNQFIQKVIKE